MSSSRSRRDEEALMSVHELVRHMPRPHLEKINSSIMKQLSDQGYAPYAKVLDLFLSKAAAK
jgi:hypothetical protein